VVIVKKVLIITYHWPPSGGITVLRCLKFVKYLREFGWEPIVFTAKNPSYQFLDYSNEKDIPEGLEIHKVPIFEPINLFKQLSGRKKNQPLQNKHRVIVHHVKRSSLFPQCPHRYTRVNCHRPRRQAAVAQGASRANLAPAPDLHIPEVVFCASPSAASAAAPRLRCRGMFSVWASAPHHALLCGVRVPATGHCACRYAHGPHADSGAGLRG
jgi:hypothetical protein